MQLLILRLPCAPRAFESLCKIKHLLKFLQLQKSADIKHFLFTSTAQASSRNWASWECRGLQNLNTETFQFPLGLFLKVMSFDKDKLNFHLVSYRNPGTKEEGKISGLHETSGFVI